ncbi:hypothetical protein LOCC1_G008816 [Lachnellula occidentalis]|uniref:Uncharacterized protein n=1 Tax=Lachnellula occidentalis TaxID=215460 RepID=A0A8H8U4P0_9HELO|nr:hypothetical protein LOCC1_G008816 [Lachnellula occidentalis]
MADKLNLALCTCGVHVDVASLYTEAYAPSIRVKMPSPEQESLAASLASKQEPRSAASSFTEPARTAFAARASESTIISALSRGWYSLIDVAADTPHPSQGPLVDIVQAVQQESLTEQEDASECTIWGDEFKVWSDMPLLGPCMREVWNRGV